MNTTSHQRGTQPFILSASLLAYGFVAVALQPGNHRLLILLTLGVFLGAVLYLCSFGFSAAYRDMLMGRDFSGVRSQILLLAVSTVLFAPALSAGHFLGQPVTGAYAPVALQVVAGASLFGIGMQLAGGCGSGTLYAIGNGSLRMLATLVFFAAGSFLASLHFKWWQDMPSIGEIVIGNSLGWPAAVALQLAILGGIWAVLWQLQAGSKNASPTAHPLQQHVLLFGAIAIAILAFLVLITAGHPWSITWGFTLWAAQLALRLGWSPEDSSFWNADFQQDALSGGPLDDTTSVMDAGIVIGAMATSSLLGNFQMRWPTAAELAAAAIGGLAMGYGARISFGCNIGAFYSGIASTSLHGWLWIAACLPGCWLGLRLRPLFGISN